MNYNHLKDKLNSWNFDVGILGSEEVFKASVLVPLVILDNKINILFQVRAKNIRQGGEISFPGGGVEVEDPSFAYTALRETHEELGISMDKMEIMGELDTLVSPFSSIIKGFLGIIKIDSLDELNINKNEVERVIVVPLEWFRKTEAEEYYIQLESHPYVEDKKGNKDITFPAKELGLPEVYHKSWKGISRKVFLYKYDSYNIWGFTALILKDALKKLDLLKI